MLESKPSSPRILHSRTAAREAVLSILYQVEIGRTTPKQAMEDVLEREFYAPEIVSFIRQLIGGIEKNLEDIDYTIRSFLATGWTYDRVSVIDRNVLRIACYELFCEDNIPPKSSINEAVTLSKKFGTLENSKFVNGLLGRMLETSPKAQWDPSKHKEEEVLITEKEESEESEEVILIEEGSDEHQKLQKMKKPKSES